MSRRLPRISLIVDDGAGVISHGEINALALGYGIHQAWIYSAMFGTSAIYKAPSMFQMGERSFSFVTLVFLISIFIFGLTLIFFAITDQKFLKFYTARRMIFISTFLTFIGTLAVFLTNTSGALGLASAVFAGVLTGIGSAMIIILWGTAFSRYSSATIVANTAFAIILAMLIYSIVLHIIPYPYAGLLTAFLPLLEIPLLWSLTPVSYSIRHAVPIFDPLPIHKGYFSLRFALPVVLFGIALGNLRTISTQVALLSNDMVMQLLAVMAGGAATVLLLIAIFTMDRGGHWDVLFRPIIPFIVITLFFLPSEFTHSTLASSLVLLAGYMCFEALMWIFFSEISQEFRLSPIYIFGIGRGSLALGSLAGSLIASEPSLYNSVFVLGEAGGPVVIMLVMVVAYALFPRVRDIRRAIKVRPNNEEVLEAAGGDGTVQANSDKAHVLTYSQGCEVVQDTSMNYENSQPYSQRMVQSQGLDMQNIGEQASNSSPISQEFPKTDQSDQPESIGWFKSQCERVADRYLLTRRETEVMYLLAKGFNAAYLQEKLYISRSTAKTHISNIYKKLDIHSQQELIALIEEGKESKKF